MGWISRLSNKKLWYIISCTAVTVALWLDAWQHGLDFWKILAYPVATAGVDAAERVFKIMGKRNGRCD